MVFCAPRPIMGAQCVQLSHDPDKSVGSNTTRSQESVSLDCSIVYMSRVLSSQSVGALSVKVSMSHNDGLIHVILPLSQLNEPALVEGLVLINVDPCAKGWIDWAASKVTFWTHARSTQHVYFVQKIIKWMTIKIWYSYCPSKLFYLRRYSFL